MSAFTAHILYLERLQIAGMNFRLDELTHIEWKALAQLKNERNRAELKEMKEREVKR